jgi:hypothetical protein
MSSSETISKHRPGYFTPKIKFTTQEDNHLRELVARFGTSDWRRIASAMGTRNPRQCRERWRNYVNPQVAEPPDWTEEEDTRLEVAYAAVGARWMALASYFPGRSMVNVKNRVLVLKRRGQRLLARQDATAKSPRIYGPAAPKAATFAAHTAEVSPGPPDQADPDKFLSALSEPLDPLFGESTTESEASHGFFQWQL